MQREPTGAELFSTMRHSPVGADVTTGVGVAVATPGVFVAVGVAVAVAVGSGTGQLGTDEALSTNSGKLSLR